MTRRALVSVTSVAHESLAVCNYCVIQRRLANCNIVNMQTDLAHLSRTKAERRHRVLETPASHSGRTDSYLHPEIDQPDRRSFGFP
jgi:hypothetical protein